MKLERLVLLGASIIAGCTTYEARKKHYVEIKKEEIKQATFEPVKIPKEVPLGFRAYRLGAGEFIGGQVTLYTAENNLKEEDKKPVLEARLDYIKNDLISEEASEFLKSEGFEIDYDLLIKDKTLQIDYPADKEDIKKVLDECLTAEKSEIANFCHSLCDVSANSDRFGDGFHSGVILGGNYIIAPASTFYAAILSKKFEKNLYIYCSELKNIKDKGDAPVLNAKVLAINPLKDLALIEIISAQKEPFYWRIPLSQNNKLDQVTFNTDTKSLNIIGRVDVPEKQLMLELSADELNFLKTFNYSIATLRLPNRGIGGAFFDKKGLVGILTGNLERHVLFDSHEEEKRNKTSVIGSTLIRSFLKDYLEVLNNKEELKTIIKPITQTSKNSAPATEIKVKSLENTVEQTNSEEKESEPPSNPFSFIGWYLGLTLLTGIVISTKGRQLYLKYNKEPEEKSSEPSKIEERLMSLESWFAAEKLKKSYAEAIGQSKPLELPIALIKRIIKSEESNATMDGFEETGQKKGQFVKWLEETAKENLKLPKEVIEFYDSIEISEKEEKLKEIEVERKTRLTRLESTRINRLTKLLDLDKI